jgi:glycosidase
MENFVSLCYANPGQKGLHCWNFLSNHDIVRFNSGIANDRKYELAVVLMYALPGNPIIYYGEEIGLPGMNDPDNRRCMEWKSGNRDSMFYILFKSLNHLRKKYKFLFEENNIAVSYVSQRKQILVIKRFTGSQSLYFIFNFSSQIRNIFLDKAIKKGDFTDVLAGVKQEPVCKLAGSGYKILSMTEDNLQDL